MPSSEVNEASATTSNKTIWPTPPIIVSPHVQHLITRFFDISDSIAPESGEQFAKEVFTKDAVFMTHETVVIKGYEELVKCRTRLDPAIASRSHTLLRVWAANSPATDLLAWGTFGMELKNGKRVVFDFTARFVVGFEKAKEDGGVEGEGQREEGEQKFEYVRVWTDPTKMLEALKKANEELKSDS